MKLFFAFVLVCLVGFAAHDIIYEMPKRIAAIKACEGIVK